MHTHVRLRPLTKLDGVTPSSSFSATPLPLAHAHLVSIITNPPAPIISPLLESAAVPLTISNPITVNVSPDDPFTYQEAPRNPNVAQWVHAMIAEIGSLKEYKTREPVRLPDGRKAIQCKWVFKMKNPPNGTVWNSRLAWLQRVALEKLGLIAVKLSHWWLNLKMSALSWPSLQKNI